MSTLLQKANQIKTEKDTKIIPSNIKAGVTAFGVTGTYEGSTPLVDLSRGNQIKFYTSRIASLLDNNLTAEQKAEAIVMEQSTPLDVIIFGTCTHIYEETTTNHNAILSLQFNASSSTNVELNLNITFDEYANDYVIYPLVRYDDDDTWFEQMTVSRLISILNSISPQDDTYTSDLIAGNSAESEGVFNHITLQTSTNRHLISASGVTLLEAVSE